MCPEQILKSGAEKELGRNVCLDNKNTPLWELELLSAVMCFINIALNWQTLWLGRLWKFFFFFKDKVRLCLLICYVLFLLCYTWSSTVESILTFTRESRWDYYLNYLTSIVQTCVLLAVSKTELSIWGFLLLFSASRHCAPPALRSRPEENRRASTEAETMKEVNREYQGLNLALINSHPRGVVKRAISNEGYRPFTMGCKKEI